MRPLGFTKELDLLIGMGAETAREWAVETFGSVELEDPRWRTRLIAMGAQAARRPGGKVSTVFTDAAARQGAYGLLEGDGLEPARVTAAMTGADARRCAALPFVYVPVDGSSVTITDHACGKGFGSIGDRVHGARGLKMINALLVSPLGVPLGLGAQVWWQRQSDAAKKDRARRHTQEKETQHWLDAMQQTRAAMAANAPRTRLWFQLDREGDAWPIITNA